MSKAFYKACLSMGIVVALSTPLEASEADQTKKVNTEVKMSTLNGLTLQKRLEFYRTKMGLVVDIDLFMEALNYSKNFYGTDIYYTKVNKNTVKVDTQKGMIQSNTVKGTVNMIGIAPYTDATTLQAATDTYITEKDGALSVKNATSSITIKANPNEITTSYFYNINNRPYINATVIQNILYKYTFSFEGEEIEIVDKDTGVVKYAKKIQRKDTYDLYSILTALGLKWNQTSTTITVDVPNNKSYVSTVLPNLDSKAISVSSTASIVSMPIPQKFSLPEADRKEMEPVMGAYRSKDYPQLNYSKNEDPALEGINNKREELGLSRLKGVKSGEAVNYAYLVSGIIHDRKADTLYIPGYTLAKGREIINMSLVSKNEYLPNEFYKELVTNPNIKAMSAHKTTGNYCVIIYTY